MLKLIIIAIILMGFIVIIMSIRILFFKESSFLHKTVEDNPDLKSKKLYCTKETDNFAMHHSKECGHCTCSNTALRLMGKMK